MIFSKKIIFMCVLFYCCYCIEAKSIGEIVDTYKSTFEKERQFHDLRTWKPLKYEQLFRQYGGNTNNPQFQAEVQLLLSTDSDTLVVSFCPTNNNNPNCLCETSNIFECAFDIPWGTNLIWYLPPDSPYYSMFWMNCTRSPSDRYMYYIQYWALTTQGYQPFSPDGLSLANSTNSVTVYKDSICYESTNRRAFSGIGSTVATSDAISQYTPWFTANKMGTIIGALLGMALIAKISD